MCSYLLRPAFISAERENGWRCHAVAEARGCCQSQARNAPPKRKPSLVPRGGVQKRAVSLSHIAGRASSVGKTPLLIQVNCSQSNIHLTSVVVPKRQGFPAMRAGIGGQGLLPDDFYTTGPRSQVAGSIAFALMRNHPPRCGRRDSCALSDTCRSTPEPDLIRRLLFRPQNVDHRPAQTRRACENDRQFLGRRATLPSAVGNLKF
ncbi:hypothetical protein VTK26DRAFT_4941 [Humicola hyalothermophila]